MKKSISLESVLPYLLIVAGVIGFICSFIIMYDKLQLLQNPSYHPSCNLNPIISCGSVMQSKQGSAFGFPNPIIGLAAFPMVATMGVLLLAGATKLKRWAWWYLQGGTVFAVLFVHWLFFESVYRIQALCPYCMGVWVVSIALFWYVLLYNLRIGNIPTPPRLQAGVALMQRHSVDILLLWYLVIAGLIVNHFWYFWKTII